MINNKVCVVVGGVDVICACAAKEMAKNGYLTAIVDSDVESAKRIADEICTFGGLAKAYDGGHDDKESLARVRAQISAELGKCNVIVNINPAVLSVDEPVPSVEVFARDMKNETGCSIVNICAGGDEQDVVVHTKVMAVKMADLGIRVNCIVYGQMMSRANRDETNDPENIPMGRLGKPEEITGALKYLADPVAASYTTGAVIYVDGGMSAIK